MTLPLYIGTIPDGTALQVLGWLNNSFAALFSQCLSPTAPEDPIGGMPWINSATNIKYERDPQNVAWVPIGKYVDQNWISFVGTDGGGGGTGGEGDSTLLGPYATLEAGEGFATGSGGQVSVRPIAAADLPVVGPNRAGIAPASTGAQANHILRPSGWSRGTIDFGTKTFTGNPTAVWSGITPCTLYKCSWEATLNASQIIGVQLGANGAPKINGYFSTRAAPDGSGLPPDNSDFFPLWWNTWGESSSRAFYGTFEIMEITGNKYFFSCLTQRENSNVLHRTIGNVTIPGAFDYLRFTTSGATQTPLTAGSAKLIGV